MRSWSLALLLCAAGAAHAATGEQTRPASEHADREHAAREHEAREQATRPARSVQDSGERWRQLIAEWTQGAGGAAGAEGLWYPPPVPVQVPLPGDSNGRASLSVLVVPVPVPVPAAAPRAVPAQCPLSAPGDVSRTAPAHNVAQTPAYADAAFNAPSNQPTQFNLFPGYNQAPVYNTIPGQNSISQYTPAPAPAPAPLPVNYWAPTGQPAPSAPPAPATPPTSPYALPEAPASTPPPPPRQPPRRPDTDERLARNAPNFPPVENSQLLVEQFRAQQPTDPMLPPIVTDPAGVVSTADYTEEEVQAGHADAAGEAALRPEAEAGGEGVVRERRRVRCKRRYSAPSEAELQAPPPPPRFERSLFLRARLTVPRADYTEPYSLWWDAASGASRIDFHGGATSTYRMMMRDGRVMSAQIRVDRTEETDVRRCVVSTPRRVSLAERALPALPDLSAFSFAGYVLRGTQRAERWRYTLSGHAGELGAARGEALTFRHELLLARSADNHTTTPLWYATRVDSSVLGADCDGYVHYFDEVQLQHHDSSMFRLDIADACEQVEITDRMENVEPLREFTMLRRDPRHDAELDRYKRKFQRVYADDVEEAVRKNLLMQSNRHMAAGNRQGAGFELATNFVSDRLVAERRVLLGVQDEPREPGERFPHERAELEALRGRLPRKFDWRQRGAVTHVRNQGLCESCWAHATVGAVEGALFVETGRLVPLSEQALVDCAGPYGGHGCKATWPSAAYDYIKDIGLPALDEYTPYKAQEQTCRADSVPPVTRISGHLNVTQHNILALKVAIRKYGPTVVLIDGATTSFATYKKGYYHDRRCKRTSSNHAVLAVGWTVHRGETYFIVKNSWSTAWGEEGYMRMRAPTDTCGLLRRPSLPRLRAPDVLRVPQTAPAAA
ncbi:counting factor associated protein D-like [Helicoverpa zea]|uniref:counting factor associated protein D-like n=1 Tax=Helicoverpa zea TaxID=7113 RepID=UPI001F58D795|nr:counting factor associated protein D-like [Helicoverpa zea]